jgi:S1-C subfamily serine protease
MKEYRRGSYGGELCYYALTFMRLLRILFLLFCSMPFLAKASEGFFNSVAGLPSAVSSNWDSTVFLSFSIEDIVVGTGFVVNRIEKEGSTEIYIATANHVPEDKCSVGKSCPNMKVFESPPENIDSMMDGASGSIIKYRNAVLVKASSDPDLAVFKIEVERGQSPYLKPLKLSESCGIAPKEMTYIIGFPFTEERLVVHRPIVDSGSVMRRWSKGTFEGLVPNGQRGASTGSILITDDVLESNSGGPLFNSKGEVIGLLESGYFSSDGNFEYTLHRFSNGIRAHAAAVSCEKLKEFIGSLNKSLFN